MVANVAAGQTPGQDLGQSGGAEPWRLDGCRRQVPDGQIGVVGEFARGVTVGCGRCEWATGHVLSRGFSFRIAPFGRLARGRCDRPMACGSFASSMPRQAHHLAAASPVANSAGHRWSRFGRTASRRSSASRQASSARRPIAFIARTSILAPRSDCEERRLATRWRTHAPCRVPPAGRSRRPCAAAPWVSSRSSSARICFSSASETRLRLTYSPQPGHVPRSPAHEKRRPQKQATSISDCLPRRAVVPADASFGLSLPR